MTKWLMTASAAVMAGAGVVLILMPQEILQWQGESASFREILLVQLAGTLYFAFAMINWMGKSNLIGGVFGRSVAFGNLTHFAVGALTLLKATNAHPDVAALWVITAVYTLFAILFAFVIFRNPGLQQCG